MSKKSDKPQISTVPCLVRETGRVFIGCDKHGQRLEIAICDSKRCAKRKKCRQYQEAKRIKEKWIIDSAKPPRRRKKTEETPIKKKRKRKQTEITTKKRRRKKK